MSPANAAADEMPVIGNVADFDKRSGNLLERMVFNHRMLFILLCLVVTAGLAWQIRHVSINANFDKVIPTSHPYIQNYFANRANLASLGNTVRLVVENPSGDIYDPAFLATTRKINDDLFLTNGVDRSWMRSIWMASVRWTEVTEEGFRGGTVMPEDFDGTPKAIEALKRNLRSAGLIGDLVGSDQRSIMIVLPILSTDPATGLPLNYGVLGHQLEELRAKYEASGQAHPVNIHIVGFAKLTGDLIDGLHLVMLFFLVSAGITALIILAYTHCLRSTVLVIACSAVSVAWQLGIVSSLGYALDPYSILVPFLIFAIGVSHAAQKMNGIMKDIGLGTHKYIAARYTFRRLFMAGLTALLADAVGFAVLMIIDVPVIKDLAVTASIGVAVLIVTNLLLLPVLLSYVGVGARAARRSLQHESAPHGPLLRGMGALTQRPWARRTLIGAVLITLGAAWIASHLKIGDLDAGAPELRADSRYNQDVGYINSHFRLSGDQFVVMVKTPAGGCDHYETLKEVERLSWALQQVPGVLGTTSLADNVRRTIAGLNEGNPKWLTISRNQALVGGAVNWTLADNPEVADTACSLVPVIAYLTDHKSDTLDHVLTVVEQFSREHSNATLQILPAAGSAGIEAVTNIVVRESILKMYAAVYGAVALLCFIAFRSWRAVLVALIPLVMTSILSKALMVMLGIGLKVSTLPVIALGVGIGVDYSLYLLSVQLMHQRAGLPLQQAYRHALEFTGKVVALVGVTLAAGAVTWVWSPIKFQADMGILLAFMFIWNMVGALILIPALSHYLLLDIPRPLLIRSVPARRKFRSSHTTPV
ncbi:efflux RND transporter permease subunit [Pseudomonas abietaniphila]|uniref:efflux RND transporter permease subunit n=1 Tax=Pseudomonas abietaniphila TaxID=89065 RepID=UPI0009E3529F|nr:MMPL family transporter [Pseudomonas abietaniphila]